MPDSLDVAHQRRLVEKLKRDGDSTCEAEARLRTMLDSLSSIRGYPTGSVDMLSKKPASNRQDSKVLSPSG
jgi:hypothetical protein